MSEFGSIPVYSPLLMGNEKKYVNECLDSAWISSKGEFISRFEQKFAEDVGVRAATSVANGTFALHLALYTLGIGPGDEVIVPTLTYIASANAIAYVGATPVFVDSVADTWNLDVARLKDALSPRTKAIMSVPLYGNPCDMDAIAQFCHEHDLFHVEDAAEAFGSLYKGQKVGSFGDVASFSFYGNKTITTGEGGMLTSNNAELIARAAYIKNQGVSLTREYWHDEIGFNFRMTNICAAIGLAQLENADSILQQKRVIADWYRENLTGAPLAFQAVQDDVQSSYWMVSVLAEDAEHRSRIRKRLKESSVETRPVFHPAHTMPVFHTEQSFPVAEDLASRGINLPSYPALTREQIRYICDLIRAA
ncbi:DegT/DnrJ/EryC1/StrS family aminotransferase [Litorivivens sp.]|uniref:DegT/DnrJ/EryC1/StrS family aminotransferase n=1 Tax=Litorivivens sp. TaxID=2020868 RepID=UPI0035650BDD